MLYEKIYQNLSKTYVLRISIFAASTVVARMTVNGGQLNTPLAVEPISRRIRTFLI